MLIEITLQFNKRSHCFSYSKNERARAMDVWLIRPLKLNTTLAMHRTCCLHYIKGLYYNLPLNLILVKVIFR